MHCSAAMKHWAPLWGTKWMPTFSTEPVLILLFVSFNSLHLCHKNFKCNLSWERSKGHALFQRDQTIIGVSLAGVWTFHELVLLATFLKSIKMIRGWRNHFILDEQAKGAITRECSIFTSPKNKVFSDKHDDNHALISTSAHFQTVRAKLTWLLIQL